jgi:hypothetical protein
MISSLKEAPGRISDIGKEARSAVGEAASDRGWFRFVRHPSQYWDLRTLATRSPSQDDAHSSAPGTAAINEGRARDAHKPARRPGEADFVHQIDPTDTLCVDSAPGWAMEAIANSDGKVRVIHNRMDQQHVALKLLRLRPPMKTPLVGLLGAVYAITCDETGHTCQ